MHASLTKIKVHVICSNTANYRAFLFICKALVLRKLLTLLDLHYFQNFLIKSLLLYSGPIISYCQCYTRYTSPLSQKEIKKEKL